MINQKIQVEDLNLNYVKKGSGSPVLLLHGWGQSSACFDAIIDELSKTKEVYALDLPGFGDSDEPKYAFDIYDYEYIVAKFIEQLNLKNVSLIGHSFGGRISIIYSASTDNVDKLILTGAAGIKPKRSLRYYLAVYHYKYMKLLCKTPLYFQYRDDLVSQAGSSDYKSASDIMKQVLSKVVNQDLEHLLTEIDNETLLYWGAQDDATPLNDGYIMNDKIPNSNLIIKQDAGHYAFLQHQEDFILNVKKILN